MDPAASVTERLLQYGVLGVVVIMFGIALVYLWRESKAERLFFLEQVKLVQQARIDDGKATQTQLLELVRQATTALTSVATLMEHVSDAGGEQSRALKDLSDEVRALADDIRQRRGPVRG